MSDHKDLTDYRTVASIAIPAGRCRRLSADECREQALGAERRAEQLIDAGARAWERREAQGWRRLALQRHGEEIDRRFDELEREPAEEQSW